MPAEPRTVLDCCTWDFAVPGATALWTELWSAIDGVTKKPASLKPYLPKAGLVVADINWSTGMKDAWAEVLEKACQQHKLRDFAFALVELIENATYATFLAELPDIGTLCPCGGGGGGPTPNGAGGGPAQHPFRSRVLSGPRPFMDRDGLRGWLESLASAGGSRVLVVNGPADSGRSHIWFLVTEGCAHLGNGHRAVRIKPSDNPIVASPGPAEDVVPSADPTPNGAWGPNELMVAIATKLGWPLPPTYDSQDDARVVTLTSWFQQQAAAHAPAPVWLVIDDLHAAYVTDPGLRLAAQIADSAATGQAGELRVVLLCYEGSLPAETEPYARRETIDLLDGDDVRAYFGEVASDAGEELEPDALAAIVAKAAGDKLDLDPFPLAELAPAIGAVASTFLHTAGPP